MNHFVGIDLHLNNSYIAVIDTDNNRIFKKKTCLRRCVCHVSLRRTKRTLISPDCTRLASKQIALWIGAFRRFTGQFFYCQAFFFHLH